MSVLLAVTGTAQATTTSPAWDAAWAEMSSTVFEHKGGQDALPYGMATAVTERGDGALWVGTADGLERWDGYRFHNYAVKQDDPRTLPSRFVECLVNDAKGRLWVGTDGGAARYDDTSDGFVRFGTASITGLAPDPDGGVWVASTDGLFHVSSNDVVKPAWAHAAQGADPLPDESIAAVLQARDGTIWIGSASGLYRRFTDGRAASTVSLPGISPGAAHIHALFEDSKRRLWIGTAGHGVFVLDPATGVTARVQPGAALDLELKDDSVTSLEDDGRGAIWIGTRRHGILIADKSTLKAHRISHGRNPANLQAKTVMSLHRDQSGQMWVASADGLSRTYPAQDAIDTVFAADEPSWNDETVLALDIDAHGVVHVGERGGLEVIDAESRRMTAVKPETKAPPGMKPFSWVTALAHDAHDRSYVGSHDGLFVLEPNGRKLLSVPLPGRGAFQDVTALSIRGDTLWLGGERDGLWKLGLGAPAHSPRQAVRASELTGPRITVISPGPGDSLWIGTAKGLDLFTPGKPVEHIGSLGAAEVNALLTDERGRLWVGTTTGVAVAVRRDGAGRLVFKHIGPAEGLANATINALLSDDKGRVWASTEDGIAVIEPVDLSVRMLHANDGVAIPMYWVNSATKAPNGDLFFGGIGGLTVVHPDRLKKATYSAAVVATRIQVGTASLAPGQLGSSPLVIVPPHAVGLSVDFSVVDFMSPERSRYAYRLDGFEQGWHDVDSAHRSAIYTNLPPDRYTLHIRAANQYGQWTDRPLSISVEVQAAWYQTGWFAVVKALVALLAVGAAVWVRGRHLQNRARELERLVEQRTQELSVAQLKLEDLAYSDALTSLPNRRMFGDSCQRLIAISQRQGASFALLLMDLDKFKQVNDTHGHDAGDALLVEIARRLRDLLRKSEFVARLGGDEFVILLSDDITVASIEIACQRIFDCFAEPVAFNGIGLPAALSIGIAMFPAHGSTQDELYKSADLALYEAKRAGRRTWRFAAPSGEITCAAGPSEDRLTTAP